MPYAFTFPVPAGKTEALRRFNDECFGPRRAEFDDMMRRSGVTEEAYWLQHDAEAGDRIVVVSSSDQSDFTALMQHPQTDFDRWYRQQIIDILGSDPAEDFGPRNESLGTWTA